MKKIIDGKRYNTETAEEIAYYSNDLPTNDFNWYEERLYLTKNGNWFVAGEGGALSGYSVSVGNNGSGGGSHLRLITKDEAKEWLEQHDEVDAVEEYFDIIDG